MFDGCRSGTTGGLGCESRAERWVPGRLDELWLKTVKYDISVAHQISIVVLVACCLTGVEVVPQGGWDASPELSVGFPEDWTSYG